MKKLYSKPGIVYEDFSISTHIAKTCDVELGTLNQGECGGVDVGRHQDLFMIAMVGCLKEVDDNGYNGVCYHHPIDGARLFNS